MITTNLNQTCNIVGPMKPIGKLNNEIFTVLVDGAMAHNLNLKNYVSIGDSDSWDGQHDYQLPQAKDRSDLYHAFKLVPDNYHQVHMHGFYGGRIDHFIINIGEIVHFLDQRRCCIRFYNGDDLLILVFSAGEWTFEFNGIFSLFSFDDNRLSIEGDCLYKSKEEYTNLNKYSSHGLSNEAFGLVKLTCKKPIVVFLNKS